ncbi:MAG TPA: GNAT family N-acetyltransferase [Solirubrobacteraceae bacterium]|nr:GNAT family N-acetyltransferase [Solirubrobacteraceae bacterium]
MTPDLTAALRVDRRVRRRAAAEVVPLPGGLVVRHQELWDVHYLNALILDAGVHPPPTAAEVVARADRWLGNAGPAHHRHVVFDDAAAGERVAADLEGAGWERRRTIFMVFAGDANAVGADPRAREISDAEMEALQLAGLREEVPEASVRSGLAERLALTQRVLRAGTPARCFGAGEGGSLQSMCTLFLDDDVDGRRVAMLEEVGTLVDYRRRGLARGAVSAAIAAAVAWDAGLIVVPADADDWPQVMYAGLGFAPVGRQVSVTRRDDSGGGGL